MQGVMQDSQPPGKLHARISGLAKGRLREVLDLLILCTNQAFVLSRERSEATVTQKAHGSDDFPDAVVPRR